MLIESPTVGKARLHSPLLSKNSKSERYRFVDEDTYVPLIIEVKKENPSLSAGNIFFEKAGPRKFIYFQPENCTVGITTCGGLCPGLNNVLRSLVVELWFNYGVKRIFGFRYGYAGMNPDNKIAPIELNPDIVDEIHDEGGTILGTSRGPQDPEKIVEYLNKLGVNILFCIGGDGTHRGAYKIFEVVKNKKLEMAIIGIPKTIDNDILYTSRSFGFNTAVEEARKVLISAHTEAKSVRYGIGLVKLMGRDSGFVACHATLASQLVNFVIIPEVPVILEGEKGFLKWLENRILAREHALIVVAEGAGSNWFGKQELSRDASGNVIHPDPGKFLRDKILNYFGSRNIPIQMKYFDPSYIIRSVPANADDVIFCDSLARNAVHAGMAGKTGITIGYINNEFVHIPIEMVIKGRKQVETTGSLWYSVLASTGQPEDALLSPELQKQQE